MIGVLDEKRSTAPRSALVAALILVLVFAAGVAVAFALTHNEGKTELPGPKNGTVQTTDKPAALPLS